jgi:hypothetical protein
VTAPQEDPDSPGSVLWACNLSGTPIFLAPTLGDADSDGDMDALSATVGLSNSKNLTLGMTPVLLATETWQMLSSSPADLQISVNDSQQWDSMATKGTKIAFDNFQMTGLHVAPEPASAAILLVGAVSLLRRRF